MQRGRLRQCAWAVEGDDAVSGVSECVCAGVTDGRRRRRARRRCLFVGEADVRARLGADTRWLGGSGAGRAPLRARVRRLGQQQSTELMEGWMHVGSVPGTRGERKRTRTRGRGRVECSCPAGLGWAGWGRLGDGRAELGWLALALDAVGDGRGAGVGARRWTRQEHRGRRRTGHRASEDVRRQAGRQAKQAANHEDWGPEGLQGGVIAL